MANYIKVVFFLKSFQEVESVKKGNNCWESFDLLSVQWGQWLPSLQACQRHPEGGKRSDLTAGYDELIMKNILYNFTWSSPGPVVAFFLLTEGPLGPGKPMFPAWPLGPVGPGGPVRPSCPAGPWEKKRKKEVMNHWIHKSKLDHKNYRMKPMALYACVTEIISYL